ncbi:MAG: hypothetical protein WC586_10580 [Methanoregula sp.]
MYPVVNQNPSAPAFWDQFSELPGAIESKLPTMDKTLDAYFDTTFASVIEEWELLTETDLHKLESRLASVTNEISNLYAEKMVLEKRRNNLDELITTLEKSV